MTVERFKRTGKSQQAVTAANPRTGTPQCRKSIVETISLHDTPRRTPINRHELASISRRHERVGRTRGAHLREVDTLGKRTTLPGCAIGGQQHDSFPTDNPADVARRRRAGGEPARGSTTGACRFRQWINDQPGRSSVGRSLNTGRLQRDPGRPTKGCRPVCSRQPLSGQ